MLSMLNSARFVGVLLFSRTALTLSRFARAMQENIAEARVDLREAMSQARKLACAFGERREVNRSNTSRLAALVLADAPQLAAG